ncbi:DUF1433 domain-containing protein [Paenibacillus turpanensis]|uniref:DUF1433 domain-containing protein n=1 Tax=Paenibacillus turpanensis TaxID=2689078 RepID=UPI00140A4ADA|nr:DUF1433 domain-containing protein [Paenibacillus turpanensis]
MITVNGKQVEKSEIIKKAEQAAANHFKEKYNLDVEFTDHKFEPKEFASVKVYGNVKGEPEDTLDASVNFADNYSVGPVSLPQKYLK